MSVGLIGRKAGMTRVFTDEGVSVPVTVVEIQPNRVTRIKVEDVDGYRAVQVTTGSRKPSRVNKSAAGEFKKAGVEAGRGLWEFRLEEGEELPKLKRPLAKDEPEAKAKPEDSEAEAADEGEEAQADDNQPAEASDTETDAKEGFEETDITVGDELTAGLFSPGQKVDVAGRSIGKGFAGTVKRHNFKMQRATHGNSLSHRVPGSIGQNQTPGRVFPGKKMAGQMGNVRCSVQNLEVVRVDTERGLLLIKGGVPGHKGGDLIIRPAAKTTDGKD